MTEEDAKKLVAADAPEDEDIPAVDGAGAGADDDEDEDDATGAGGAVGGKQNRNEKKARKALLKLGLKPVPSVAKVTVKKSKAVLFVINKPDVFRAPGSDSYVIFGEAKVEDASASAQADAAAQFARPSAGARPGAGGIPAAAPTGGDDDDGDEDASGVEEKDIKLVMDQAGVERGKAIKALKKNNSDIVSAIMDLTLAN